MISGVVFCPSAPALLPALTGDAAAELDPVRDAAVATLRDALGRVAAAGDAAVRGPAAAAGGCPPPASVTLLCAAPQEPAVRRAGAGARAGLAPLGLEAVVPLDPARADGPIDLPVAAAIGSWLLDAAGWAGPRECVVLRRGLSAEECRAAGAALAAGSADHASAAHSVGRAGVAGPPGTVLLVLADGAACHGPKAPGYDDPAAGPFDDEVAAALAAADARALVDLDPARCGSLLVDGREAWQAAAGAALASGGPWEASLAYRGEPYGVGYLVASWLPARR